MPYRVFPDGTIETDTVEEIIGVARAIEVDSILGSKYSKDDSTEEFLRVSGEIIRLVQEKKRIEAEIRVLLQRQKQLVGKAPKPQTANRDRSEPVLELEPDSDYFAIVGLEVVHEGGDTYSIGKRMVVHKWGDRREDELLKMANESIAFFGLTTELRSVELTKSQVEALRAGPDQAVYCSDLGIEVP